MKAAARADAIVVLGAAVRAPGEPGPAMRRRVAHAVTAWRDGRAPTLVLSGGIVGTPPSEAEVMADLVRAEGIAKDCLVLEDRSRNTFENALYTGRIMRERGWRRIILVTDPFHMPRAVFTFRRLGLSVVGDAVRHRGAATRREWYGAYAREPLAFVHSAWLFLIGRHRSRVRAVWGS